MQRRRLIIVLLALFIFILLLLVLARPEQQKIFFEHDLDADGHMEQYDLQDGQLRVSQGGDSLWNTPSSWRIQSCTVADINGDGKEELLLVLWKRGSFGRHLPFWVEKNDSAYSSHLFVFNLINGHMKSVWCSSALDRPIRSLTVLKADQTGQVQLQVSEGRISFYLLGRPWYIGTDSSYWAWETWGFYRVDE